MEERFPKERYHWIPLDRTRNYQTSDGIHLVKADAEEMTAYLLREAGESK